MILVTGATGKVGRHLVAGLLAEGAAVVLSSMTVRDNGTQPYSIGAGHKALEDAVAASVPRRTFRHRAAREHLRRVGSRARR